MDTFIIDDNLIERIDSTYNLSFKTMDKEKLNNFILKAKLIGKEVHQIDDNTYAVYVNQDLIVASTNKFKITDGENLFAETRFREINLNNVDTSELESMIHMFYKCKAKRINLSMVNTSKVWCMTGLFMCTNLEELDISSFDTSEVLKMTCMFYKSNIKNLIGLNKLDTSKVTEMYRMFTQCEIPEIDISNFNTSKVTNMEEMFMNSNIQYIKGLDKIDTSNSKDFARMFQFCNTKTIDLSNFKFMDNITQLSVVDLIRQCKAEIILPKHRKTANLVKKAGK